MIQLDGSAAKEKKDVDSSSINSATIALQVYKMKSKFPILCVELEIEKKKPEAFSSKYRRLNYTHLCTYF